MKPSQWPRGGHLSPIASLNSRSIANTSFHWQAEVSFLPWTHACTALSQVLVLYWQYLHIFPLSTIS